MPSSPHATDGTTYKIRGWKQKRQKKLSLLGYSCNTPEEGGGESKQKCLGSGDDITHDPYTRENEDEREKTVATEIQTEMYIYTPVIYKNKVSLGGAS